MRDGSRDWFNHLDINKEEMNAVLNRNPSVRGMLSGYLAEEKLRRQYLLDDDAITAIESPDDHDRDTKADWVFEYRGEPILCEVKSLQSNSVEQTGEGHWEGKFQCDASDCRQVTLPTGDEVETTCLVEGEFDILAVNLFEFGHEWRWAFARNEELPRTTYGGYDETVQEHLLKGTMDIQWPLGEASPYEASLTDVLESELEAR